MKRKISAVTGLIGIAAAMVAGIAPQPASAGATPWSFSSSATARDTQTFATVTSVKHDVGADNSGGVEVITISGTTSAGTAISAAIKLPATLPPTVITATMVSALMTAARNCEKQGLLFKSGLSGATSFVMRSYAESSTCGTGGCFDLTSTNVVISCSLE